jgi:pimeloyl-ACP methyl ester carboxylesterase
MRAILIHGVPDTFRVWDAVIQKLSRKDVVALALPGFDSDLPDGFKATKEEYVAWIIQQLEREPEPVDLVGHDWGCLLTARVASLRPDLVRTWAGGGGPVNKDYVWHPLAKVFQTPGAGEKFLAELDPKQFSNQLEGLGVPTEYATDAVEQMNDLMKQCILGLYRSAVDVGAEWQPDLKNVSCPGLVLWGNRDDACPVDFADRLATDLGASRVLKLDTGHWFELEKPGNVAKALEEHWAAVIS